MITSPTISACYKVSPWAMKHRALWLLAFMWIAYFLNYCDRQAVFAMFKVLKSDLGMSDQQLGLTGSIFLWVYGVGCPIAGQIADRVSKRFLVVASLAIWSCVTIATGLAQDGIQLLSLRAAMGISESLFMPAAIALTASSFAVEKRSRAVAVLTTAQIAGVVGGAWFGGSMAEYGLWRHAFFCLGMIGLVFSIPYFRFLQSIEEKSPSSREKTEKGHSDSSWELLHLFGIPSFVLLCFIFPSFLFGLWMLYSWLANFLREKFELDLSQAAFTATVYLQTATFFGLIGGGILADRLYRFTKASRLWILCASLVLCAPCLHAIGNSSTLTATCAAASAFGLFSGLFMGNIFPSAFEIVAEHSRASAVGVLNFCGAVVSGFAPWLGGRWKESVGIEQLLSYTSILYIIAAMILAIGIQRSFDRDYLRVHREESPKGR